MKIISMSAEAYNKKLSLKEKFNAKNPLIAICKNGC